MNRRQFAQLLTLCALPWPIAALPQVKGNARSESFMRALRDRPWLAAWGNIERDHYASKAAIHGRWPAELNGVLYRTGPARHEIYGYRNHHWFDGDGMVHAYRITATGVSHQARLVETAKVKAERIAGRALYPGLTAAPPNPAGVTRPDDLNTANTSILYHQNRLLALWEAGSPYEINPETLATEGIFEFEADGGGTSMRGVPFSAHPRVDVDGSVWNFGYASTAGLIVFWHIGADGKLHKTGRLAVHPMTMPHDFVVTEKHLVLLLPPFHYRPSADALGFLSQHEWRPDDPCRVLVVDKNDLTSHYFLELPAQWIFHYGNAWEDSSGIIRFDAARAADPGTMTQAFTEIMHGGSPEYSPAQQYSYRLDTRARRISEQLMLDSEVYSEFPCIDPRLSCRRYRKLVFLSQNDKALPIHGFLNEVSLFDIESGDRAFFRYPESQIPEEHLYLARPGSAPEASGWILGTAFDWRQKRQIINLFDAQHLTDGPVASAELPYAIPLGLHGKFVTG